MRIEIGFSSSPEIDIIVRGEGEETIIDLLQALEHKQPLDNISGISHILLMAEPSPSPLL